MADLSRMRDKLKEAAAKSIPEENKEKAKKAVLKKLSINENEEVGAALGVAKALAEKRFKLKINKNLDMDLKLDKNEKRVGFSYKKRF